MVEGASRYSRTPSFQLPLWPSPRTQCRRPRLPCMRPLPYSRQPKRHASLLVRAGTSPSPSQPADSSTGCYLQCVECGALYAVEAEELDADSRAVQCALCRHEWLACERDLLWGAEHALPAPPRGAEPSSIGSERQKENSSPQPVGQGRKGGDVEGLDATSTEVSGDGYHIFVGNLSFRANEQDLMRAFGAYGTVRAAQIPTDGSGASRGYGFIEMARKADGLKAIRALQGVSIVGRDISLSEARPRRDPHPVRERVQPRYSPERERDTRERSRDQRAREMESSERQFRGKEVEERNRERDRDRDWERDRRRAR